MINYSGLGETFTNFREVFFTVCFPATVFHCFQQYLGDEATNLTEEFISLSRHDLIFDLPQLTVTIL